MKKLNASYITGILGMPIKQGTLNHLQQSYQEILDALCRTLSVDPALPVILYGCVNSTGGSLFTISAGAIYWQGEVYLVDTVTFTAAGGQTAVGTITTIPVTAANADPVLFTDGVTSHSVHDVRKIVFASGISASGAFDYNDVADNQISLLHSQVSGAYSLIALINGEWSDQTLGAGDLRQNSIAGTSMTSVSGNIHYKIDGKTMHVCIRAIGTTTSSGAIAAIIIKIPGGIPTNDQYGSFGAANITASTIVTMQIQPGYDGQSIGLTPVLGGNIPASTQFNMYFAMTFEIN